MTELQQKIKELSNELLGEAIRVRRELHANPEISFREFKTAEYIGNILDELGVEQTTGIAGTGIIARIRGERGTGPVIALRAELDALPIAEKSDKPYRSREEGIMHACGHDAHMAMLLASVKVIDRLKDRFRGEVIFLFQPGEELVPGGASLLLDEGTLRKIKPDAIIAQHVLPELETGKVGFCEGKYMASSDEIYIDIKGKGGHAALPGQSTDQVLIGAMLVTALKEKVAALDTKIPRVLGIGKFIASGATNVIPDRVHIEGTLRTFDEEVRSSIHRLIRETGACFGEEHGVTIETEIRRGYPVLTNNPELTRLGAGVATALWGSNNVMKLGLRMSSEDFAFYSQEFPALFYRLGVKGEGMEQLDLHTASFDIDESAMAAGIATISSIALELANNI